VEPAPARFFASRCVRKIINDIEETGMALAAKKGLGEAKALRMCLDACPASTVSREKY
jgi:hypothetical protein